jgi:hypothetical protein
MEEVEKESKEGRVDADQKHTFGKIVIKCW